MKLTTWVKNQGISYLTGLRWFHAGKIPNAYQMDTGTIIIPDVHNTPVTNKKQLSIYCRVSSHEKKGDLERQAERCVAFANANGYEIISITKEIASGMNDKRPKLLKLLETNPPAILVEHKDRLTRFGFNYFDILLPKIGCQLLVMNRDAEENDDLMKDLIAIITSFCCRLYGLRCGQQKKSQIKEILENV
jgi:predicted site-specific integrase-resolvase